MRKWEGTSLFPVKIQVPIFMTVYALISFKAFEYMRTGDKALPDDWFDVPEGYESSFRFQKGRDRVHGVYTSRRVPESNFFDFFFSFFSTEGKNEPYIKLSGPVSGPHV
eukprot:3916394-Pyramimonas_sp.AAC.1